MYCTESCFKARIVQSLAAGETAAPERDVALLISSLSIEPFVDRVRQEEILQTLEVLLGPPSSGGEKPQRA